MTTDAKLGIAYVELQVRGDLKHLLDRQKASLDQLNQSEQRHTMLQQQQVQHTRSSFAAGAALVAAQVVGTRSIMQGMSRQIQMQRDLAREQQQSVRLMTQSSSIASRTKTELQAEAKASKDARLEHERRAKELVKGTHGNVRSATEKAWREDVVRETAARVRAAREMNVRAAAELKMLDRAKDFNQINLPKRLTIEMREQLALSTRLADVGHRRAAIAGQLIGTEEHRTSIQSRLGKGNQDRLNEARQQLVVEQERARLWGKGWSGGPSEGGYGGSPIHPGGGGGGGGPAARPPKNRGPVAGSSGGPGAEETGGGGQGGDQPAGSGSAQRVPAAVATIQKRLERLGKVLQAKGQHQAVEWLGKLCEHISIVGPEAALAALGQGLGPGKGGVLQYSGVDTDSPHWNSFIDAYLRRAGVTPVAGRGAKMGSPLIASLTSDVPWQGRGLQPGDFKPGETPYANKLQEAKDLPGLQSSEDLGVIMGRGVTHLNEEVMARLNERYGDGKWLVKNYSPDDAFAGQGIHFPQHIAQVTQDARATIWAAGENLAKHGFGLNRDETGLVTGLKHQGGDTYDFGSEKYQNTIYGDVRSWGDLAASAAENERGLKLSGPQFMAQPAFPVVGVSEEERAAGKTIGPGEGRVHVVVRDGKARAIPHATWLKGESLPVVFENEETRAMAKAAEDAVNALPQKAREGQVYGPDVVKTPEGFKVVELNASVAEGGSGYLSDNPFVIDSFASHLAGRDPAHVSFVRDLLTKRAQKKKDGSPEGSPPAPPIPPSLVAAAGGDGADGGGSLPSYARAIIRGERGKEINDLRETAVLAKEKTRWIASPEGKNALREQAKLQKEIAQSQREGRRAELVGQHGKFGGSVLGLKEEMNKLGFTFESLGNTMRNVFVGGVAGFSALVAAASPMHWHTILESFKGIGIAIGTELLPYAESFIQSLQNGERWIRSLDPAIKSNVASFAMWTLGIVGGGAALIKLVTTAGAVATALKALGVTMTLVSGLTVVGGIVAVTAAVAGLALAWHSVSQNAQSATTSIQNNQQVTQQLQAGQLLGQNVIKHLPLAIQPQIQQLLLGPKTAAANATATGLFDTQLKHYQTVLPTFEQDVARMQAEMKLIVDKARQEHGALGLFASGRDTENIFKRVVGQLEGVAARYKFALPEDYKSYKPLDILDPTNHFAHDVVPEILKSPERMLSAWKKEMAALEAARRQGLFGMGGPGGKPRDVDFAFAEFLPQPRYLQAAQLAESVQLAMLQPFDKEAMNRKEQLDNLVKAVGRLDKVIEILDKIRTSASSSAAGAGIPLGP